MKNGLIYGAATTAEPEFPPITPAIPKIRTSMPRAIRYHPKTVNECFLMNAMSLFIIRRLTTNAVTIPTRRSPISWPVTSPSNFKILRRLAPSITGIARKKVNLAAASLLMPIAMDPTIVEPDLDAPGKIAARS